MKKISLALIAAAGAGCVTATNLTTSVAGGTPYVNGKQICPATPCEWMDSYGLPERYHLQIFKPGYRPVDLYVDKQMSLAPAIAGAILAPITLGAGAVFFLWDFKLPDQIGLTMEPVTAPPPPRR